jgi:5-formyltetrahydrofolate cyclo-ligase
MIDSTATLEAKAKIRETVRQRLKSVTDETRKNLSQQLIGMLKPREAWQKAQIVLGYLPIKGELDVFPCLEAAWAAGKEVALPRFLPETRTYCAAIAPRDKKTLVLGAFGILEPGQSARCIPLNQLDFVLVPGLAFDASGKRLGRGKGFYDRLLAEVNGVKCGVALDEQIVQTLPTEPHDIAMNFILTPSRWLALTTRQTGGACTS